MRAIKIKRTISKDKTAPRSTYRRSIRHLARDFFAKENHWEFAIQALLFGLLMAISTWPIVAAANAINQVL